MNPTLGLAMMAVAAATLALYAFQGRLVKRTSDPEGRDELREMAERMRERNRRRMEGGE